MCNVTGWTDGDCDQRCNSTECKWDGYDCLPDEISNIIDGCDSNCSVDFLNNGYCDSYCQHSQDTCSHIEYASDCLSCDTAWGCESAYNYFSAASNQDDIIDGSQEWCSHGTLFDTLVNPIIPGLRCDNITNNPKYDLNMNNKTGFWEFIVMFGKSLVNDGAIEYNEMQLQQINCTLCLGTPNETVYYM